MKKRIIGSTLRTAAAVVLSLTTRATATTYTWDADGTTDHKWSTPANWNPDGMPTFDSTADLVFGPTYDPATGNSDLNLDGNRVVRSLSLEWSRANTLTLSGGALTLRDVTRTATATANSPVTFYASGAGNHGAITLSGNSLWNLQNSGTNPNSLLYATVGDGGAGHSLTKMGVGALILYDNASFTGNTIVRGGVLQVNGGTTADTGRLSATPSIQIGYGATFSQKPWNVPAGNFINDDAAVALYGGTFAFTDGQNQNGNHTETIGTLKVGQGQSVLTGGSKTGYKATLQASSLSLSDGGALRFAPTTTTGQTNAFLFTAVPTLVGGGGGAGTANRSIIRGLGLGTAAASVSLVTYDGTLGLVGLNTATEFASSINGVGATTDQNVRRGTAETLTADRTINSLVWSGAANATIDGSFILNVAGGMINAYHGGTLTLGLSQLQFGGGKGYVVFGAGGVTINAAIANATDLTFSLTDTGTTARTVTLGASGSWSGNTYVNGSPTAVAILATGSTSELLPDGTTVHLGYNGQLLVGNTTETVAGVAGIGEVKMNNAATKIVVGSGTATAARFIIGGGATTGTLAPGLADDAFKTGTLTLRSNTSATGGLTLGTKAVVNLELAGFRALTTDFDVVSVPVGDIVLGGTLNVTALAGFTPVKNDSWIVMTAEKKAVATVSGSFSSVTKGYTADKVDTNADTYNDAVKLTFVGLPAGGTAVMVR